ncbi:MAG: CRISPR-associated helicase Cas3' [Marinifilaceae bacterium]|jgi:CRISPR-associated endonuclease/helicase Cas3|nr:CRISPR-associated helicase Cas3' [Marinifilaceae bacterium]
MVSNINFESHPGKKLEKHIEGVLKGTLSNSDFGISRYAALFHDLGKINPNFQLKLYDRASGYSNHSALSVIVFVNYAIENRMFLMSEMNISTQEDYALFVLQVSALIFCHHKNLKNFKEVLQGSDEIEHAVSFLNGLTSPLPIVEFIKSKLHLETKNFKLVWSEINKRLISFSSKFHQIAWGKAPLNYFLETQQAFASLIEADKRDAGNNSNYFYSSSIENNVVELNRNLAKVFLGFENSEKKSKLDELRTAIRLEAVENLENLLNNNERVFTLTAPTGAGKTYTLLALANQIRSRKGNLGIIYSLPFLSITEQVEKIASGLLSNVLSVNSKNENERIENAQISFENNQTEENLKVILKEDFIQNTFDHPFVITTFVQFFETLVSNRNSTLLKLPNFRNRIFLIDEVQALPPRLYIFFSALLTEFCRRYNSYAIVSTATMPKLDIPIKDTDIEKRADLLFKNYLQPAELLNAKKYFSENIFNRYQIKVLAEKLTSVQLTKHILSVDDSCLVILNTIADTKDLYVKLKENFENIYLLNTHFIPEGRTKIIDSVKQHLEKSEKVILISTQLIEAGVDIDFPIVFRDMCPLPSLIQSAGRCNRNNLFDMGLVCFFELISDSGQSRSKMIYRNEGSQFLEFCKKNIPEFINENELFNIQSDFFSYIKNNLTIGEFKVSYNGELRDVNMIECINRAEFEKLGSFKLIDNSIGRQQQYYILKNDEDYCYEELESLIEELKQQEGFENVKRIKIKISDYIKKLSSRIINIRVNKYNESQMPAQFKSDILGIKFISTDNYSEKEGLILNNHQDCYF